MNFQQAQAFNAAMATAADAARKQAQEIDKATKNLKDMATATRDAEKRFNDMKAKVGGQGSIGESMGALSNKFGAVLAVAGQVANQLGAIGKSATILADAQLSAAQKTRLFSESLPVVGGIVKALNDFKDGLTGVAATLDQQKRDIAKMEAQKGFQQQYYGARRGIEGIRDDAEARRWGLKGAGMVEQEFGDTSTAAGQRAYQATLAQQPALLAQRQAKADLIAAQQKRDALRSQEVDEEQRRKDAERRRDKAIEFQNAVIRGQNLGNENRPGAVAAAAERQSAQSDILAADNALLQIKEQKAQNILNLVKAESDARKAAIQLDKVRVSVLDQQLSLIKSQATSFGALTSAERQAALEAARTAKTQGFGALSEEQRGLLGRAGGAEFAQDAAFKNAQQDPRFAEFQGLLGQQADFGGIQKDRNEAQKRILEAVQVDEQGLADAFADKVGEHVRDVIDLLDVRLSGQLRELEARIATIAAFR